LKATIAFLKRDDEILSLRLDSRAKASGLQRQQVPNLNSWLKKQSGRVVELKDQPPSLLRTMDVPKLPQRKIEQMLQLKVKGLRHPCVQSEHSIETMNLKASDESKSDPVLVHLRANYDADKLSPKVWQTNGCFALIAAHEKLCAHHLEPCTVVHHHRDQLLLLSIQSGRCVACELLHHNGPSAAELQQELLHFHQHQIPLGSKLILFGCAGHGLALEQLGFDLDCDTAATLDHEDGHDQLLLLGAAQLAQHSKQALGPMGNSDQGLHWQRPLSWLGVGLLFWIGALAISQLQQRGRLEQASSQLLSELRRLHKSTLEAGQRRTFSEMAFVKTLERKAVAAQKSSSSTWKSSRLLFELQSRLKTAPPFELLSFQFNAQNATASMTGLVSSVHDHDRLMEALRADSPWSLSSNFSRVSGRRKGLNVNLKLELER
jgi:hypothetical protein